MKSLYRRAVAGYRRERHNPVKREMYLRASLALKVDLARRIRFKSATGGLGSFWKRIVRTIEVAKMLNEPYTAHHGAKMIEGDIDEDDDFYGDSGTSPKRLRKPDSTKTL